MEDAGRPEPKISLVVGIFVLMFCGVFDVLSIIPGVGDIEDVPGTIGLAVSFVCNAGSYILVTESIAIGIKAIPGVQMFPAWTAGWIFVWIAENHPNPITDDVLKAAEAEAAVEKGGEGAGELEGAAEEGGAAAQGMEEGAGELEGAAEEGGAAAQGMEEGAEGMEGAGAGVGEGEAGGTSGARENESPQGSENEATARGEEGQDETAEGGGEEGEGESSNEAGEEAERSLESPEEQNPVDVAGEELNLPSNDFEGNGSANQDDEEDDDGEDEENERADNEKNRGPEKGML